MSPTIESLVPWLSEPNHEEWTDAATGYMCLIHRHDAYLHLCGYVPVPVGHPAFGKCMSELDGLMVHGGVTWADIRNPITSHEDVVDGVALWWIGFDCSHAWDMSPGLEAVVEKSLRTMERGRRRPVPRHLRDVLEPDRDQTYRDWFYVQNEVLSLAQQLKSMERGT